MRRFTLEYIKDSMEEKFVEDQIRRNKRLTRYMGLVVPLLLVVIEWICAPPANRSSLIWRRPILSICPVLLLVHWGMTIAPMTFQQHFQVESLLVA